MKKLRYADSKNGRNHISNAARVAFRGVSAAGLVVSLLVQPTTSSVGAELVLIGNHPTSTLTGYPTLHTLKAHDGRVYCGYGEWVFADVFPAVVVASYDPAEHAFRLEFSAGTDSIGLFREIGGTLYVPSIDGSLHEEFHDYSYRQGGVWRDRTPAGMYHTLDLGTTDGTDLWLTGSKSVNETATYNHAAFRSADGGRTWQDVTLQSTRTSDPRYYWGFGLRGKFYVIDTVYDGTNATRTTVGSYVHVNKATAMGSGATEFVVAVTGWVKGTGGPVARPLVTYDTQSWRTLRNNVVDFTVNGTNLFTLETNAPVNAIWMASAVTPSSASWQKLSFNNVPSNAKCIEVLNGVVYIGDTSGRLWCGRLDGGTVNTNPPAVINELPDKFGAALSFDGDMLAVGAPDHSGASPLSGQVTIWEPPGPATGGVWARTTVIDPPTPSFCGWFGKRLALKNDVLAVVEAGRNLSRVYRGSSAQVHLYERAGQEWLWRNTIDHPQAQSVALDSDWLALGGTNSLSLYRITRTPEFGLTFATNLSVATFNDFRATACVDLQGDLCAFGVHGDISFGGGPGEVQIYQRDEAGVWGARQVLQSPVPAPISTRWAYDPAAGVWRVDGQSANMGVPQTTRLTSPALAVNEPGAVQLSFTHRWSFEAGGWDGGQVHLSINGGPYVPVAPSAFTTNGYNGMVLAGSYSIAHGQEAFINESSGHAAGTRVTSSCEVGVLSAGDTVSVQFVYAADSNTRGALPNWEIDTVTWMAGGTTLQAEDFNATDGGYAVQVDSDLPPDRFGFALALGAEWLAIGSPRDDTVALQAGAVHLYQRTNSAGGAASFVLRQSLLSPINQQEAGFGSSVELKAATLLVGCPGAELEGQSQHGTIYVFRLETNSWQLVAEVPRPSATTAEFGAAVAFGSNWLAASSRFSGSSSDLADRVTIWPLGPAAGELLVNGQTTPGMFEISARGELGQTYHLQKASQLPAIDWSDLLSFTLTSPSTNLAIPLTGSQGFIRLVSDSVPGP